MRVQKILRDLGWEGDIPPFRILDLEADGYDIQGMAERILEIFCYREKAKAH